MGNAIRNNKLISTLVALALAVVVGIAWVIWPSPEAPKSSLSLPKATATAPVRHVAPALQPNLQMELDELSYTPQKAVTNDNQAHSTYQIWTSPNRPSVELNDLGTNTYRLHTISFANGVGDWKNFWCSPADDTSLTYATNFGEQIGREIADGSAALTSSVGTPKGTMFIHWSTLTCYVSND